MDNAANAMAAGRKTLSREEALGQEASSALLQGGTVSDTVSIAGGASENSSEVVLLKFTHQGDPTYLWGKGGSIFQVRFAGLL